MRYCVFFFYIQILYKFLSNLKSQKPNLEDNDLFFSPSPCWSKNINFRLHERDRETQRGRANCPIVIVNDESARFVRIR
jgi:hypothetical protein